jgi:hypothetical protein
MADKKNGDYEKPESKGVGEDLDDVSGGAGGKWQPGNCASGDAAQGYCGTGSGVTATSCTRGESPHPV